MLLDDYGDDEFEEEYESIRNESSTALQQPPEPTSGSSQRSAARAQGLASQPGPSQPVAESFFGLDAPPDGSPKHASPKRSAQASSSAPDEEVERLRAELKEAVAERDHWRKLHTADSEWLVQSCRLIEDPRAKRPGGGVGSWRGLAATAAGAAAIAGGGGGGGGGGKKGGKQGGFGKVAIRPQQQAPPRAAGPARSEGSLAPEVMQVAEVLRSVAEIRGREIGRRTNMEELVLSVEALLVRFARTYAADLARRKLDRKPPHGSRPHEAASASEEREAPPPGLPPRAPAAGPAGTSSFASPVAPPAALQQGAEVRALRQRLAKLQLDNQRLSEQLSAQCAGADAHGGAGNARLPYLVAARAQDDTSRQGAALRVNRPGRAEPDKQSLAQVHAHKPRPRPGGDAAAGGWSEWEEPEAEPRRKRVPPVPSKSRLVAAESRLAAADAAAEWSEGDVAARIEELGALSPRLNQKVY